MDNILAEFQQWIFTPASPEGKGKVRNFQKKAPQAGPSIF